MNDTAKDGNAAESEARNRLADAIREVKNAVADRDDVVVDIREAQRTRLELLAEDLQPVFAEIPRDDERFDLAISAGSQPRLWIDSVAHVTMGRDRRTYRFLRDTRLGRVVLAESSDIKTVADQVTRYIAERVVERRRLLEGEVAEVERGAPAAKAEAADGGKAKSSTGSSIALGIAMVLLGGLVGFALILLIAREQFGTVNLF